MTVGEIIGEAIDIHKLAANKKDPVDMIKGLLARVGLTMSMQTVILMSSPADKQSSVSALPVHLPLNRNLSYVMSRFPHWTFLSSHRL